MKRKVKRYRNKYNWFKMNKIKRINKNKLEKIMMMKIKYKI